MRVFLLLSTLQLALSAQPFAYEIARAKQTLGDYGSYAIRDERVHARTAERGSKIDTYCAITQARNYEGKVEERVFYWVLRVKPQPGFLSDYERGTWSSPAPGEFEDYQKLCVDTAAIADVSLLRSDKHKSSGSTYDPTSEKAATLTREWLIGNWVSIDSCATSRDAQFRADGVYDSPDERGTWELRGSTLQLTITEAMAEPTANSDAMNSEFTYLGKPRVHNLAIERLDIDQLRLRGKDVYRRC